MEEKEQKSKKCCYCGNFEGYYNNGLLYTMSDEISEPSPEKAINQLQELAQKGYFTISLHSMDNASQRRTPVNR